jgi:hypothetical protein
MDATHVAPRKRARMAVPRRMDRRAEAGLGVRSSEVAARWRATPARLLTVKIRQPSHEFTFGVGMSFIPYPLVLTPVV